MKTYILVYQVKKNYEKRTKTIKAENIAAAWEKLEEIEEDRIICQILAHDKELQESNNSTLNSMCINCLELGKSCKGTTCKTWTGCVYRRIK